MKAFVHTLVVGFALVYGVAATACQIHLQDIVFDTYNPLSQTPSTTQTYWHIYCPSPTPVTIEIAPSANSTGNYRRMLHSSQLSESLQYTLSQNANYDSQWGLAVNGQALALTANTSTQIPVYGLIPARQDVMTGVYQDMLTVIVNY